MQIEKNTILSNGELYKVVGESKLYWLVNPLIILDKFRICEDVMLVSMNSVTTYVKYSTDTKNTKEKVSLYFDLDLKGIGLLDDKKWRETIEKGYDQMKAFLSNLPATEKFWMEEEPENTTHHSEIKTLKF